MTKKPHLRFLALRFLMMPLLLLGVLVGCAPAKPTEAQNWLKDRAEGMRAANVRLNTCLARAQADPSYVAVRHHFASSAGSPTDEQLADNTLPTAEDVANLRSYALLQEKCRTDVVSEVERFSPVEGAYYRESLGNLDAITNNLIERKITWGESVKRIKELAATMDEKLAVIHDKMAADLKKQHKNERRQRRMDDTAVEE